MYGNSSARDFRASQRGELREQLQQEEVVEVVEDPELITVQEVQGQETPDSPTVGQLKVVVHRPEEEVEVMPEQAYTAAVARLIEVDNAEVKKKAKKIAAARRKMDGAVEVMWDAIKSADKSTCPSVKERIAEIRESMTAVMLNSDLLRQTIEDTVDAVTEHLVDAEQADMEATLMRMLDQAVQHARRARQEGHDCQDRLEKFNKTSSTPPTPAQPARGAGSSTGSWNMWKGDQSLKPTVLSKDAVPCDFRNFQRDFATYIKSGETANSQGTAITISSGT